MTPPPDTLLIAGLFDPVSMARMAAAERAVRQAAGQLPAGVAERLEGADSNIDDLLEELNVTFHRLRQGSIDEELFDVISGFEALPKR